MHPICNGVFYELIPPGQISCSNALFELVGAISEATQRTLQAVRGGSTAVNLILLFASLLWTPLCSMQAVRSDVPSAVHLWAPQSWCIFWHLL